MFSVLLVISIIFTANPSWALDWKICYNDLENQRKMSKTESNARNLAAAGNLAIELNDLYNAIQFQKFEYEQCRTSTNGTLYCVYIQRRMNGMIIDYNTERSNFDNLMLSFGKHMQSIKEPCGFKLSGIEF